MKRSKARCVHIESGQLYLIFLICIYLISILIPRVGIYDWQKEIAYFEYIKEALSIHNSIPFIYWQVPENLNIYPTIKFSKNFIANPETFIFSPFIILLKFLPTLFFIKLLSLIHLLIGVAGLHFYKCKAQLTPIQNRTFIILFFYSPLILQHLAIGYLTYLNLFFYPWLLYFLIDTSYLKKALGVSAVLALCLLQGSSHVCLLFSMLSISYIFFQGILDRDWKSVFCIVGILFCTTGLSYARIFSTATVYYDFSQSIQSGYNPINFFFWSIIPPIFLPPFDSVFLEIVLFGVPSWDGALYLGSTSVVIGIVIIRFKSFWRAFTINTSRNGDKFNQQALFLVVGLLFFFSFFSIFEFTISAIHWLTSIPFIMGMEKYPFRLMIPSYLGMIVLISLNTESIWRTIDRWRIHYLSDCSKFQSVRIIAGFLFLFSACICFGLSVFTITFRLRIIEILKRGFTILYNSPNKNLLSLFIKDKSIHDASFYMNKLEIKYFLLQSNLLIISIFLFLLFLILRYGSAVTGVMVKIKYTGYEFWLLIPLLYASLAWFTVSIATPIEKYQIQPQEPFLSKISGTVSFSDEELPDTIMYPDGVEIHPVKPMLFDEFRLRGFSKKDMKYLKVVSGNAVLKVDGNLVTLSPTADGIIKIGFQKKPYIKAVTISVIFWLFLLLAALISKVWSIQGFSSDDHKRQDSVKVDQCRHK